MSTVAAEVLGPEEEELELSLRPRRLDEFVGQEGVKEQLAIALAAAKARGEALDHVLLVGPPGLGKTTLAQIIREELGVGIRTVAGPALERKGDMAAILTGLELKDVLFVDEIHRINRSIEEILYPALEDFRLDIIVGQGPAARTLTLDLPQFTLVGATTRTGLLTTPLRDRFGMTFRLGYYDADQLSTIVRRSAGILGVEIEEEACAEIASRSRGTPRIANRILRRVRDVAEVRHQGAVTNAVAREALDLMEIDEEGLEGTDRELLHAIAFKFDGGPVGLSTLAVTLGEETDTIEDVYEPYLLQLGFLQRTPRGRVITKLGRVHIARRRLPSRACSTDGDAARFGGVSHPELKAEQAYVDRAYEYLERMREIVLRAGDAADGEVAQAALDAWAAKRLATFEDAERGLMFGRLDFEAVERALYVGRRWVHDDEGEQVVVNWQAPAARPFYTATPQDPQRVTLRRRFRAQGRRLVDIADEALDGSTLDGASVGDFLLEELERSRDTYMRDIVATIQADQYRLITREPGRPLVIQGGPGTGKTAVGLHAPPG